MKLNNTLEKFKNFIISSKKIFFRFFLSYVIILLIPIVSTFFICSNYQKALNQRQKQQNEYIIDKIGQNVTDTLQNIRSMYTYVVNSENIDNIIRYDNVSDYRFNPTVDAIVNPIFTFLDCNIDTMFIYIKKNDTILARNAICNSDYYYSVYFNNSSLNYEDWIAKISSSDVQSFTSYYNRFSKKTNFIYSMPYKSADGNCMFFCTIITSDMFFANIPSDAPLFSSDVYLFDDNSNLITYSTNRKGEALIKKNTDILSSYNSKFDFINKTIYPATCKMTLTLVYPKTAYDSLIKQMWRYSLSIVFICILICFSLIIWFCTKHYTPIIYFMRLLNINSCGEDYEEIRTEIQKVLTEKLHLKIEAKNHLKEKRKLILSKYMMGNYSQNYIEKSLLANEVTFDYDYITICVIQTSNINELYGTSVSMTDEAKYKELLFIIDNIFNDLFNKDAYNCDVIESHEKIFGVINSSLSSDEVAATIEEVLNKTSEFLFTNFNIDIEYTVSAINHNNCELSVAANEALYMLNYKNMLKIDHPLFYNKYMAETRYKYNDLFLSPESEQTLINYLTSGQEDVACEVIEHVFSRLSTNTMPLNYLRCAIIDIASVLFKVPQTNFSEIEQYEILNDIFEKSTDIGEAKQFIINIVKEICSNNIDAVTYKDKRIIDLIKYIEENFQNPDLSLKHIGSKFYLDPDYLSRQLKLKTGLSIVDYINKCRINKAKELLVSDEYAHCSTEVIATLVGYNVTRTFNRIFIKYEGISPAAYKKSHGKA